MINSIRNREDLAKLSLQLERGFIDSSLRFNVILSVFFCNRIVCLYLLALYSEI